MSIQPSVPVQYTSGKLLPDLSAYSFSDLLLDEVIVG
jgi:hypothetical protein